MMPLPTIRSNATQSAENPRAADHRITTFVGYAEMEMTSTRRIGGTRGWRQLKMMKIQAGMLEYAFQADKFHEPLSAGCALEID